MSGGARLRRGRDLGTIAANYFGNLAGGWRRAPSKPRFIMAEVIRRLGLDTRVLRFTADDGTRLHLHNQNIALGLWAGTYGDTAAVRFCCDYLRRGDLAVDVGANIGHFAIAMARSVGTAGAVIAIEPNPACYRCVLENARLNGVHNITAVNVALCDEDDVTRPFYVPRGNSGEGAFTRKTRIRRYDTIYVPCRSGRSLLAELGAGRRISLLKVDVEGAELLVFQGLGVMLGSVDCILFEYAEPQDAGPSPGGVGVLEYLRTAGFEVLQFDSTARSLAPFAPRAAGAVHDLVATPDVDGLCVRTGYTMLMGKPA